MSLEEIKEELDNIGATYVVSKDNESIKAIFPEGTTIASVSIKKGDKKGEVLKEIGENYYFQNGIKIVFPARNKYRIAGILGRQVIFSPF